MRELMLETVLLAAGLGLRCRDAWSGQTVQDGLRCTLRRKRDGIELARAAASPSGVQHWPGLRAPWNAVPPPAQAEILVEDEGERFLALRLDSPPLPDHHGAALASITLLSAPQRAAPTGSAALVGLLIGVDGKAAAWARLRVTDAAGRQTEGMSDAAGRFALHLPFPLPDRAAPGDPPSATPGASVTLQVFHDAAVGLEAAGAAPLLHLWQAQAEVRALANLGAPNVLGPLRVEPGRPVVPHTEGLPSNRSELRLAPL
ncbi:hypothetical protein [Massilia sp. S19_KUP03_FR1]|uniref:hypothetical protein n=1 Tax=Massilia sp. S19_KUP03_FR1 TaxID=3025503 RepID=UPI002FCD7C23